MAKPELGIKRTCPDTGKRFYDLNKKVIVSPYSNNSWPLSYFETPATPVVAEEVCNLDEETEVKHTSSKEDTNTIDTEDNGDLDMEYVQEIDLEEDDDFLEPNDSDTDSDSDIVDIDTIDISEDIESN
ncbi:TIGR02300 family protein [Candidatus Liberibacter africanus]|uniref:TIGR02300 family protein n=1 Tax=Candidatus Liberibacter africanus PTSAPSY TaxID=1277257 RepID=A0A0G3I2T4_LIBAF|nr:TIGR02300 family protein [Candidatus Liberibacter africanus]AKK20196.1 hypothetical protein G293_02840 [Candidatus Liberibacter africanus PTSAPSY]QTP63979.1 TIGR02300 family protein [Candidatus Liberibacter africanus]